MKELKFNIQYLLQKKEIYIFIIGILLINCIHIAMVIYQYPPQTNLANAEYQYILNNNTVNISSIIIIIIPILGSLVLSDSTWEENKNHTTIILHPRIDTRKNTVIRWGILHVIIFFIIFIGFMLNYVVYIYIMGSGKIGSDYQELAFNLVTIPAFFLDTIRSSNPVLYVLCCSAHVSFLLSLLVSLSYTLSFFIRQRLLIYFLVPLCIIIVEVIVSILGYPNLSIVRQLQTTSKFSLSDSLLLYSILLFINVSLLTFHSRKKDILL